MSDIIRVTDLTKHYTNDGLVTTVLHGLTFSLAQGEFVAIMGPSGSGKSTLMHILGFLDLPSSGTYEFDGRDVSTLDEQALSNMRGQHVGFIFQSFNLLPKATVLENVQLPLLYSDTPRAQRQALALKVIADVGLEQRAHYLTNQLSGGERQRVAIARALIRQPSIIFADEPTGNLDSKSGAQVMRLLQDLNLKHGHTIVLVTHALDTADYAERILCMQDGLIQSSERVAHRRCF